MIIICNSSSVSLEWEIRKGASNVLEDLSSLPFRLFLINSNNMIPLEGEVEDKVISATIPAGLVPDTYSLEAVWIKNENRLLDDTMTGGDLNRSRVDGVFCVTNDSSEATNPGAVIPIKVRSQVASYGKDGLSAYELAVFRGVTKNLEGWLNDLNSRVGTTAKRPALGTADAGIMYFDTTLSKPIWWTGTKWINAIGTQV